jgi:hypothetical protein
VTAFHVVIAGSFWLFLVSSLAILFLHGGGPGRTFSYVLVVAVFLTFGANSLLGTKSAYPFVFLIDLGLLVYVAVLSFNYSRFWPLWFAGFHSISVASGIAYLLFPVRIPEMYVDASGFLALPALGAVVAGVLLDRRALLEA